MDKYLIVPAEHEIRCPECHDQVEQVERLLEFDANNAYQRSIAVVSPCQHHISPRPGEPNPRLAVYRGGQPIGEHVIFADQP